MIDWDSVEEELQDAKAIAWDTCHKIYVLMDDAQVAQMREYEYDPLITSDQMSPREMFATVKDWFERSCFLRFVESVATVEGEDDAFTALIPQGASDNEPCDDCGQDDCAGVCNDEIEDEDDE